MLIKCEECSKEISSNAEKCPNCGCPCPTVICQGCRQKIPSLAEKCPICERCDPTVKTTEATALEVIGCIIGAGIGIILYILYEKYPDYFDSLFK